MIHHDQRCTCSECIKRKPLEHFQQYYSLDELRNAAKNNKVNPYKDPVTGVPSS